MGLKDKEWIKAVTLTTTVAAAGVSLAAWKSTPKNKIWPHYCFQSFPGTTSKSLSTTDQSTKRRVYAVGGHGSYSKCIEVWVLNSALLGWTEVLPAANADTNQAVFAKRSCHAAAGVGSDIYVIGGYTNKTVTYPFEPPATKTCHRWNLVEGFPLTLRVLSKWLKPSLKNAFVGQGDVLKFNTEKERWSTPIFSGDPLQPRSSHSATAVGKKVYVFGGHGEDSALNDVHILDTELGSWTTPTVLGFPPAPRCAHSAVLLEDGERILIYGGYTNTPESDIWFLEVGTTYVQKQRELAGKEVVAWSKGSVGESPRPVVICGPSGVGKGTLIAKLMKEYPNQCGFSVSHTTRKPRNMEQDGVHYHFTQRADMEADVEGKFLESAVVHGNLYGTSIAAVEAVADAGKRCILDIDVQGAELVKKSLLDALFIFISPPTFQELEARLRGRGTETEEQIQKRLKNAKAEMDRSSDGTLFEHVLVNDMLDDTYKQLKKFLSAKKNNAKFFCVGIVPAAPDSLFLPSQKLLCLETNALENGFHRHEEPLPEARSGHSATNLESKVLVYGGVTSEGTPSNDLLVFDTSRLTSGAPATTRGLSWSCPEPKFDFWQYLNLSPSLSPRYNHRVVPLSSTEVLLTGGYDGKHAFSDSVVLKFGNE